MIPKAVKICGILHSVIETSDNFDADASHMGQIEYKKCLIYINKDMDDSIKQETLCHEILHAMLVHLGYDELSQDEKLVQALANAVNQTFMVRGEDYEMSLEDIGKIIGVEKHETDTDTTCNNGDTVGADTVFSISGSK